MSVRRIGRAVGNVGEKVLTGGAFTTLVFFWALTAYAFSKYFDFTGQTTIFIAHKFVDLWGNERVVYSLDFWGGFYPMARNISQVIDMFFDIPTVPNLGNWFNFVGGDFFATLKAIFNVMTLGFPLVIRIVAYVLEIGIWMMKAVLILPICFLFSLSGGILDLSFNDFGNGHSGSNILTWFDFSLSNWLNSFGL